MGLAQGHNEMCTGGELNQGPLGPKSDALSTAPLRPSDMGLVANFGHVDTLNKLSSYSHVIWL